MGIVVYNRKLENHQAEKNNIPIYRGSVLGNPYTHLKLEKTKAIYQVKTREEAIKNYSHYFDLMYKSNVKFKRAVDILYEKYKNGEDIYLECYCKPEPCHGDIIIEKLEQRLLKEKIDNIRKEKSALSGQHRETVAGEV